MLADRLRINKTSGPVVIPFIPTDLPDCELWLESTDAGITADIETHGGTSPLLFDYKASFVPDLSGNGRHAYSYGDTSGPLLYDINPSVTSNTLRFLDPHMSTPVLFHNEMYMTGVLPYFPIKTVFVAHRLLYNQMSNLGTNYVFTEFDNVSGTDEYDSSNRPGYTTLACQAADFWKYYSVSYNPLYDGNGNVCPFSPTITRIMDDHKSTVIISPSKVVGMPSTASSIEITLNITHPNISDLKITLTSPNNKKCVILDHQGGSGQNLTGAKFSDTAAIAFPNNQTNYSGTYLPNQALSVFNGQSTAYSWFLEVEDSGSGNVGTIDGMTFINSGVTAGTGAMFFPDWRIAVHVRERTAADVYDNLLISPSEITGLYEEIRLSRGSSAITNRYGVAGFTGSGVSSGDVSLVLYYSRVLSNVEKNQVIDYINSKFPYTPSGTITTMYEGIGV